MAVEHQIPEPDFENPHVVILGAGASRAACPNGDRDGRRLPLMCDFVDVVGLGPLLKEAGVSCAGENFEALYSNLVTQGQYPECVAEIERATFDYFSALRLPDRPTVYDHLVRSLRSKDFIASFNWDPFLLQAVERLPQGLKPPEIRFLHGCVSIAFCDKHKPLTFAKAGFSCQTCGSPMQRSRLLFPVTQKNYNADPHCAAVWHDVRTALKHAYLLTVFGYGAPSTDVEAVRLLREAWGTEDRRGAIEVIDIRPQRDVMRTWKSFFQPLPSSHYVVWKSFYSSQMARYPRRSCEAFWQTREQCDPPQERPLPRRRGWEGLARWSGPLIEQESVTRATSCEH